MTRQIEARFLCYPDSETLKSGKDETFCWKEFSAQIDPSLLTNEGAPCPVCGNTITVKPVTAMGVFMKNMEESEDPDGS